jgi:hypothetical protein
MTEKELERLQEGQNIVNNLNECRGLLNKIKDPKGTIHLSVQHIHGKAENIKLLDFVNREGIKAIIDMIESKMIELEKEFEAL